MLSILYSISKQYTGMDLLYQMIGLWYLWVGKGEKKICDKYRGITFGYSWQGSFKCFAESMALEYLSTVISES